MRNKKSPDAAENKTKASYDILKKACDDVFATKAGLILLKYLISATGWNTLSVVAGKDGEINPHTTSFNEGRRSVMAELNRYIDIKAVHKAELLVVKDEQSV